VGKSTHLVLGEPVTSLSGVGIKLQLKLHILGIYTIQDLLFHLPYRYIDRTQLIPIDALHAGQEALTQGLVELTQVNYGKRRSLLCHVSDGTGTLILRFFHFSKAQQANLTKGSVIRCWGSLRRDTKSLEMIHPEYQHISPGQEAHVEQTLTPVYPTTEGLAQRRLRKLTEQALKRLDVKVDHQSLELLPEPIRSEFDLYDLVEAIEFVHRPPPDTDTKLLMAGTHPAQRRLAFEELLAHQLTLQSFRKCVQTNPAPSLSLSQDLIDDFISQLPFSLTGAQREVLKEIQQDIQKEIPMLRLIQGDVGSGKTVLAAIAALQTIGAGYQVAIMAPTELLAAQHFSNFLQWLPDTIIPVHLLTGKLNCSKRQAILSETATLIPLIIVGTHALLQEEVVFGRLGLIIIDEQHRFGVHQRLTLYEKGGSQTYLPHQLIMTATPIPRTLAMTVFAGLDLSIVDELPPGRKPVNTTVIANNKRPEVIKRIADIAKQGRQVYWVCTLIEESDVIQSQAANEVFEYLSEILPEVRIRLIHGRMKSADKEQVMLAYKSGEIDLLVATTVIEVGVDVPNASLMVIENAERLGLSQLHQLRGRIGRSEQQGDCVLMYQLPLTDLAKARLEIMRNTSDGFEIAQKDMELRGPGEIFGLRQTGLPEMRIADLVRDSLLIPSVQKAAQLFISQYPDRVEPLTKRWLSTSPVFGNV